LALGLSTKASPFLHTCFFTAIKMSYFLLKSFPLFVFLIMTSGIIIFYHQIKNKKHYKKWILLIGRIFLKLKKLYGLKTKLILKGRDKTHLFCQSTEAVE